MMNKKMSKVFESDRKMELRMRLAVKQLRPLSAHAVFGAQIAEKEMLNRIIARVRRL